METAPFVNEDYIFPHGEISRNRIQHISLFAIYQALTYIDMGKEVDIPYIVSSLTGDTPYEEADVFLKSALVYSMKYRDEIVKKVNSLLKGWTFSRRNRIEQAVYLLAYVHFFYIEPMIDKKIVIDIAINLVKTYVSEPKKQEHRMVNAVLDRLLQR